MALTELQIKNIKPIKNQQKLSDGAGLYLLVKPTSDNPKDTKKPLGGGKEWKLAYRFDGKQKTLALGTYPNTTLAQARVKRDEAKALLSNGQDPSEHVTKKAKKAVKVAEKSQVAEKIAVDEARRFDTVALTWHASRTDPSKPKCWSATHAKGVMQKFTKYIFPVIGHMAIESVDTHMLWDIVSPIEDAGKIETAHRVLTELNQVFTFAVKRKLVLTSPTLIMRGGLSTKQPTHYPCFRDPKTNIINTVRVGEFMRKAHAYQGGYVVRAALCFLPLVATRPANVRFAEWCEIDFDKALWMIPAEKMKNTADKKATGTPFLVPLSNQAVEILRELYTLTGGQKYVFSMGADRHGNDRVMSDATLGKALRSMGYSTQTDITPHGFRGLASTLLNEMEFPSDHIESQLGHKVGNQVRGSYNHAQYITQRTTMMQSWSDYLYALKQGADIVTFKRA
ncbi:MAG: integrase arm-type DNA-binding domain-containing protein [Sulfuriferula sp.]|nr:integrase arm-type DNA-binding domain-containing protein [Sulfuriferula sp.]